jgi:bifunctional DNA-binding transcriptional regulator/antitoxin component of YhaV-PrlF toxin-antitoxin module
MDKQGRVTIPAAARRALGLDDRSQLEWQVSGDTIVLRAAAMPDEDAWANTPAVRESLQRAQEDAHAGRTYRVSREFLEEALAAAEADRDGRELTRDDALAMLEAAARAGRVERW